MQRDTTVEIRKPGIADPLLVSRAGAITTVTLYNPARLNALSKPVWLRDVKVHNFGENRG